jgi:hypothetical protein
VISASEKADTRTVGLMVSAPILLSIHLRGQLTPDEKRIDIAPVRFHDPLGKLPVAASSNVDPSIRCSATSTGIAFA